MRVTASMILRNGVDNLSRARELLAQVQEQASTGLRINRPSDDPVGVRAAAFLKDGISHTTRFQSNVGLARMQIQATEAALADSMDIVIEAETIWSEGINGTTSAEGRRILAGRIDQLLDRLLSNANARVPGGGYLFAGFASTVAPFVAAPTGATFVGDNNEASVEISIGVRVQVGLDGERVFQGGEDIFNTLASLRDGLLADDDSLIDPIKPRLTASREQLNLERGRIGASDEKADLFEERLSLQSLDLKTQLSLVENIDAFEVFTNLTTQETALQTALQVTSRLIQPSLLDFIG